MIARLETRALAWLLASLLTPGCALTGRAVKDESDRIDAITDRASTAEEELAFAGRPPPAAPPNPTASIIETSPSYEIKPDLRRPARSSSRSRKALLAR